MERAPRRRRPGLENSRRQDSPHRAYEGTGSKGDQTFEGERVKQPSSQREKEKGSEETQKWCLPKQASTRQSHVAKESKHKGHRNPDGSPCSLPGANADPERKRKRPPSCAKGRGEDKTDSSRAGGRWRGDRLHARSTATYQRSQEPRTTPRASVRPTRRGRGEERREPGPTSPKRRPHLSPESREPVSRRISRLFTRVGALGVALDELRAPGGAFLAVSASGGPEPAAPQRAWLSWQLEHAGAAVGGAVAVLDALLAAQPWPEPAPGAVPASSSGLQAARTPARI